MKVVVFTDVEGVSGVTGFEEVGETGRGFERSRRLLTGEVNAAVEGMITAGADDILIVDGHGCDAINIEDLHWRAKLLHGKPFPMQQFREELAKGYCR